MPREGPAWSIPSKTEMTQLRDGIWYVNAPNSGLMLLDVQGTPPPHWNGMYENLITWFEDPTQSVYVHSAHGYITLLMKMRSV